MKAAELETLGRRAVACPRWRWMPGMRSLVGPGRAPYRYVTNEYAPPEGEDVGFSDPIVPDLSDPATLGCLLHLVREAHGDGDTVAFVAHSDGSPKKWCVDVGVDPDFFDERKYVYRSTEAEALVAALEAAP